MGGGEKQVPIREFLSGLTNEMGGKDTNSRMVHRGSDLKSKGICPTCACIPISLPALNCSIIALSRHEPSFPAQSPQCLLCYYVYWLNPNVDLSCTFSFFSRLTERVRDTLSRPLFGISGAPHGVQDVVSTNLEVYLKPKAGRGRFKQSSHLTVFNLRVLSPPSMIPDPSAQPQEPSAQAAKVSGGGLPRGHFRLAFTSQKSHLPLSIHATGIHPPKTSARGIEDSRESSLRTGLLLRCPVVQVVEVGMEP